MPSLTASRSEIAVVLDAQTARLDQANGRTSDVIAGVDKCDERNAELLKSLQPSKRWFR